MFVGLYLIRFEHKLYTVLLKVDSLFIFCFWFETKFVLFFCLLQFFFFRISALLLNSEMIIKLVNISRFVVIFLFRLSVLQKSTVSIFLSLIGFKSGICRLARFYILKNFFCFFVHILFFSSKPNLFYFSYKS